MNYPCGGLIKAFWDNLFHWSFLPKRFICDFVYPSMQKIYLLFAWMSTNKYHNVVAEKDGNKVNIACQHLQFCQAISDSTCTPYIFILQEPLMNVTLIIFLILHFQFHKQFSPNHSSITFISKALRYFRTLHFFIILDTLFSHLHFSSQFQSLKKVFYK